MKKLIILFFCLLLCSCSIFRKVDKNKQSTTTQTESKAIEQIVDKSVTTIVEKKDTTITTPNKQVVITQELNVDSLIDAITHVKNDLVDISFSYDKLKGVLTTNVNVKPQVVPISFDKVTKTTNDITTNKQSNNKVKAQTKEQNKVVTKESVPKGFIWLGLAIVAVGAFLYWRKR